MRVTKTILTMAATVAIVFGSAGDSAPFLLDTCDGTRVAQVVEPIAYSTAWDDGTAVSVAVDGVTLKEASVPASGDVVWNAENAGAGSHTLTHTTFKNGVASKVETATFQVEKSNPKPPEPVTSDLVTDVVAKQRYPWNGLVDITCKVTGISGTTKGLEFAVAAVMPDTGNARRASHFWVVKDGTTSVDLAVHANGNYRLLWDARADLGQMRHTNMVVSVTLHNPAADKVQLWAGGPYWATTNIGAEKPEDYGYYFWWGDMVGYRRENGAWVASDGSSSGFSFGEENTPTDGKSYTTLKSEGWITADGVLAPEHDAAYVQWGGSWRMPTKQELSDLNSNCDWIWATKNGVRGYVVRGRGDYTTASIFLPCAGYGYGSSLYFAGSRGYFWSSVPFSVDNYYYFSYGAWGLYFNSSYPGTDYSNDLDYGRSVRPVQGFTE